MRNSSGLVAALTILAISAAAAAEIAYPTKPMRLIVPYVPGGGVDFVGRTLAQKLSESWGQQVIVDNRPGGGTNIGTELVARAAPDGYTLLIGGVPNTANAALYKKLPYDVVKDFAPVILLDTAPNVLAVHPSVPVKSVRELIALAKTRRGALTYASAGIGSSNHLSGELFRTMAGIEIVHVPYKGGGAAVTDLMAGQISMYFGTTPSTMSHVRTGKLRALGVTTAKRTPAAPDVPTIAEAGLPGYEQSAWHGLLAPAGTPQATITKLHAEVLHALRSSEVAERFAAQGIDVIGSSPAEFAVFIKQDLAKYEKLVKTAGIRID
ncbi:MAG: tripartite tricarboxylate transporter substrate binding protein [Betaproteobacteria bacterium]|nr:tripartite tricarboxylate transporter substrate binding protein [Betaproteobacteria bacterium]